MLFRSQVSDPARLHDAAVYHLRRSVSRVFKLPLQRVDGHTPLEAYGIDSVLVTQLTTALEAGFGPLPQTLFFEYQTLDALAGYFEREHADRLHALVGAAAGAAAVSVPGWSFGLHQTSDSGNARLISVVNGIFSATMPGTDGLVATGRLNTAASPGKPCFFNPVKTTH